MHEEIKELLDELEGKIKLLIELGKASWSTPTGFYPFDIFVTGILNRSVSLLRGFISLMRTITLLPLHR